MDTNSTQDLTATLTAQSAFNHVAPPDRSKVLNSGFALAATTKGAAQQAKQGLQDINQIKQDFKKSGGAPSSPGKGVASVGLSLAGGALATKVAAAIGGPAAATIVGGMAGLGTMSTIHNSIAAKPSFGGKMTRQQARNEALDSTRGSAPVAGTFEHAVHKAVSQAFGMKNDIKAFEKAGLRNGVDYADQTLSEISGVKLDEREATLIKLRDNAAEVQTALNVRDRDGLAAGSKALDAAASKDMNPADAMRGGVMHNV